MPFEPYYGVFAIRVSAVLLFRSFSANPHFHSCPALIFFIFIIIVLRYFCRMYLQNFTQHHNTTSEKTKKSSGTEFAIFLLNYIIIFYNIAFICICCLLWLYEHSFGFIFLRWVHSNIKICKANNLFNQKRFVNYFTNINFIFFTILPVNKVDTMC